MEPMEIPILGGLLAVHLICVGLGIFAPLVTVLSEILEARGHSAWGPLGRRLATAGLIALVAGTLIGAVYGWLLWERDFVNSLQRLRSRLVFGGIEWLFSLGLLVVHRIWWGRRPTVRRWPRGLRIGLVLLAASNLAYHFPVLFEVLGQLQRWEPQQTAAIESAEFRGWLLRPAVLSQVAHFLIASVAVGGASLYVLTFIAPAVPSQQIPRRWWLLGKGSLIAATTLQLFIGSWVVMSEPVMAQRQLLPSGSWTSGLFWGGLLLAILLLPHAFRLPASRPSGRQVALLAMHVTAIMLLMSLLSRSLKELPMPADTPPEPHIVQLQAGAATAEFMVSQGCNCFSLRLAHSGGSRDWLWATADIRTGHERPSACGIPILFPFPGRIAAAKYSWQGKDYELDASDGRGNAIHGFVHARPWDVIEQSSSRLVAKFASDRFPEEVETRWPSSFELEGEFTLNEESLQSRFTVRNVGDQDLPFGLGLHPYFRLPDEASERERVRVASPVGRQWELQDLIPTGSSKPLGNKHPLQGGEPFGEMHYDAVFSEMTAAANGQVMSRVAVPLWQQQLVVEADPTFSACVIYTPPHREAVCIEPYTCLPNPFEMTADGHAPGLAVLPPQQAQELTVAYRVESL